MHSPACSSSNDELTVQWKTSSDLQKLFLADPSIVAVGKPQAHPEKSASLRQLLKNDSYIVAVEKSKGNYNQLKPAEFDPSIVSFGQRRRQSEKADWVPLADRWYKMSHESLQKQGGRPMRPILAVNGLPQVQSEFSPSNSTASPARADATKNMLKSIRPLPLRHIWQFWSDKHSQGEKATSPNSAGVQYEERLKPLETVATIKVFWEILNNVEPSRMYLRDSYHMFKKNVKPIWEDPRNVNGGCWTFRVNKSVSQDFWREVLALAVGEQLQEVVEKGDDICGVTISARFNSHLIMVWNRDGSNQKSIDKILERVLDSVTPELKPQPQNYYYKKHSEHQGFGGAAAAVATAATTSPTESKEKEKQKA